jgi:hypothetical protein
MSLELTEQERRWAEEDAAYEAKAEKAHAEFTKNVRKLIKKAAGVLHRKKWVQDAEWAKDAEVEFIEVDDWSSTIEEKVYDPWYKRKVVTFVGYAKKKVRKVVPTRVIFPRNDRRWSRAEVGAVCAVGAVRLAARELGLAPGAQEIEVVNELLSEHAPGGDIVEYNDQAGRTKQEVSKVFSEAVEDSNTRDFEHPDHNSPPYYDDIY